MERERGLVLVSTKRDGLQKKRRPETWGIQKGGAAPKMGARSSPLAESEQSVLPFKEYLEFELAKEQRRTDGCMD